MMWRWRLVGRQTSARACPPPRHTDHATPAAPTDAQVLSGARLPESEDEWAALRAALGGVRQHLRADSSVDLLFDELRDFVGMVVSWWEDRKKNEKGEGGGGQACAVVPRGRAASGGCCRCRSARPLTAPALPLATPAGQQVVLLKRVASAGMLLGPLAKKGCMEFLQLAPQGAGGMAGHQASEARPPARRSLAAACCCPAPSPQGAPRCMPSGCRLAAVSSPCPAADCAQRRLSSDLLPQWLRLRRP